jgi:ribosomal protein S10
MQGAAESPTASPRNAGMAHANIRGPRRIPRLQERLTPRRTPVFNASLTLLFQLRKTWVRNIGREDVEIRGRFLVSLNGRDPDC